MFVLHYLKTVFNAVRKSTREKRGKASEEKGDKEDEPPVSALGPSSLSKSEAEPVDVSAAPGGQEVQQQDDGLNGEQEKEEEVRRATIKGEEKKSRLQMRPYHHHYR